MKKDEIENVNMWCSNMTMRFYVNLSGDLCGIHCGPAQYLRQPIGAFHVDLRRQVRICQVASVWILNNWWSNMTMRFSVNMLGDSLWIHCGPVGDYSGCVEWEAGDLVRINPNFLYYPSLVGSLGIYPLTSSPAHLTTFLFFLFIFIFLHISTY